MIQVMLSTLLHSFIRIMLSLLRTFGLGRFAPVFIVIWNKAFTSHNYLNIRSIVPKLPVPQYWQQPGRSLIMSGSWCDVGSDVSMWDMCIIVSGETGYYSPRGSHPRTLRLTWVNQTSNQSVVRRRVVQGGCFNFPTNSRRKVAPGIITIKYQCLTPIVIECLAHFVS